MLFDYHDAPMAQPHEQIRLLRLLATDDHNASIQSDLHAYTLDESPPYTAISYTWGDTLPTIEINVNGRPFRVRMNCWHALWQIRYHQKEDQYYWIDSICINQHDIQEKNAQVSRMGDIYSKALLTASCLGWGSHLAVLTNQDVSITDRRGALKKLHQKAYWSRIWIKQEIILSKDIRLFCGADCLDWDMYGHNARMVADTSQVQVRSSFHENHTGNPVLELWRLLERYGDAECHDPRDKVYALLSLLPKGDRAALDLPIDYECELTAFWLKLARSCLNEWCTTAERLHTKHWPVPSRIMVILQRMAQHWFLLRLDQPEVRSFIAEWHVVSNGGTPGAEVMNIMQTRQHVPCPVIPPLRLSEYQNRRGDSFAWMSAAMPVSEVGVWLTKLWGKNRGHGLDHLGNLYHHSAGDLSDGSQHRLLPFTVSSLPFDARVKVVIADNARSRRSAYFLVPAFIEFGDQLLGSDIAENRFLQTPIVRFNEYVSTANGRERQSILVGWALQLQYQGTFLDGTDSLPLRRSILDISEGRHRERLPPVLNLHYEDLMLQALLKQDALAYLTHPRTHSTHPSFMVENIAEEDEFERDRGIFHEPHPSNLSQVAAAIVQSDASSCTSLEPVASKDISEAPTCARPKEGRLRYSIERLIGKRSYRKTSLQ